MLKKQSNTRSKGRINSVLSEKKINNFLNELASSSPTPGGGSVAALSGALGAALVSMVANLTLGKKKYLSVEDDVKKIRSSSEKLRNELSALIDEDIKVFNDFIAVYKMPKESEIEKKARSEKIQKALIKAAEVPCKVGFKCLEILTLSEEVAKKGNINVVSDAGVAALMAEAALDSAILNVKINLKMIKDEYAREELNNSLRKLIDSKKGLKDKALKVVEDNL